MNSIVREALYGATDTENMNITLFTGVGGKEEFSNAILADANKWKVFEGALNNTY